MFPKHGDGVSGGFQLTFQVLFDRPAPDDLTFRLAEEVVEAVNRTLATAQVLHDDPRVEQLRRRLSIKGNALSAEATSLYPNNPIKEQPDVE